MGNDKLMKEKHKKEYYNLGNQIFSKLAVRRSDKYVA